MRCPLPLLLTLLVSCAPKPEPPPTPGAWSEANGLGTPRLGADATDIVLAVIDTLRADEPLLGLRAWAKGGRSYRQGLSASTWTLPSMAATLSGRELRANHKSIPPGWPLLAEVLRDAGYRTHAIVANAVLAQDSGAARGFDAYELSGPEAWDAAEVLRRADAFWKEPRDRPRFLYLHFMDPHLPYGGREAAPRSGWSTASSGSTTWRGAGRSRLCIERWRRRYDAQVEAVDGALSGWLRRTRPTLAAVMADHGEGLFTRGLDPVWLDHLRIPRAVPGCGDELKPGYPDHGLQRFDEAIRVPLFLVGRGVPPGVEERPVRLIDLARTLLVLAGAEPIGPQLPLGPEDPAAAASMGTDKGGWYLRSGAYKLLRERDGRETLHRVSGEDAFRSARQEEVTQREPARQQALHEALDRWLKGGGGEAQGSGPETEAALKALGYIE